MPTSSQGKNVLYATIFGCLSHSYRIVEIMCRSTYFQRFVDHAFRDDDVDDAGQQGRILAGAAYGHLGLKAPPQNPAQAGLFSDDPE